jgi:CRP-like cAMP-binding protein
MSLALTPQANTSCISLKHDRILYCKDQAPVTQGEAHYCFKVLTGLMGLCVIDRQVLKTLVGYVLPGELFGEEVLFNSMRRHTATALVDSEVQRVLLTREVKESLFEDVVNRTERLEALYAGRTVGERLTILQAHVGGYALNRVQLAQLVSGCRESVFRARRLGLS